MSGDPRLDVIFKIDKGVPRATLATWEIDETLVDEMLAEGLLQETNDGIIIVSTGGWETWKKAKRKGGGHAGP